MKSNKSRIAWVGLLLFVVIVLAAVALQSAWLLYAASLLPIVIVPFLPDFRSRQRIGPSGKADGFHFYKVTGASTESDILVIEFRPGSVKWKKKLLVFPVQESRLPTVGAHYKPDAAALSVLQHDIVRVSRKGERYGILLGNLVQRSASFSFTTNEVTRLVISLQNIRELSGAAAYQTSAPSRSKRLQA